MCESKTARKKPKTIPEAPKETQDVGNEQLYIGLNKTEEADSKEKNGNLETQLPITQKTWLDFIEDSHLIRALDNMGLPLPNKLQRDIFSVNRIDKNLHIQSKSGSGKSIASILRVLQNTKVDDFGISTIYMVSSFESGYFIDQKFNLLSPHSSSLQPVLLISRGNEDPFEQFRDLDKGLKSIVLISTPKFILRAITDNLFKWDSVKNIVIDDLDGVLTNDAASHTIETIFENPTRNKMITLTTSKTTSSLTDFVNKLVGNLEEIKAEECHKETFAHKDFKFFKASVRESSKCKTLVWILEMTKYSKCVVFLNSPGRVLRLHNILTKDEGICCVSIHHKMGVDRIIAAFNSFVHNGPQQILLITSVKGRSISMNGIDMIVNFDLPSRRDKVEIQSIYKENIPTPMDEFVTRVKKAGRTTKDNKIFSLVALERKEALLEEVEEELGIIFKEIHDEEDPDRCYLFN